MTSRPSRRISIQDTSRITGRSKQRRSKNRSLVLQETPKALKKDVSKLHAEDFTPIRPSRMKKIERSWFVSRAKDEGIIYVLEFILHAGRAGSSIKRVSELNSNSTNNYARQTDLRRALSELKAGNKGDPERTVPIDFSDLFIFE